MNWREYFEVYGMVLVFAFIVCLFLFFLFSVNYKDSGTTTVIDNSKVFGQRFYCKSLVMQSCGATCITVDDLEYHCLTNFRVVGVLE